METARDIALVFLSLQALVIGLIPFALLAGLAYGVLRLRPLVVMWLRAAFEYAEIAREAVERYSRKIAEPFMRIHSTSRMVSTMFQNLTSRR